MERIKKLDKHQIGILILMLMMSLIFAVIYHKTISTIGYKYNEEIFVPTEENGKTVYSGKIEGEQAEFIVSDDTVVVFNYGDKTYGPYTVKEDATAIPKDDQLSDIMTGIEVREGSTILFRGGVIDTGSYYQFTNEDGTGYNAISISYETSDGMVWDENGNPIDKMKPSISTIYELTNNPELTHKGVGIIWFAGVFICIMNAVSILFADELFRLKLAFRIRNVEHAEPSDWEMTGRYFGWISLPVLAFIVFFMGLRI